jgi:hypothetical protein
MRRAAAPRDAVFVAFAACAALHVAWLASQLVYPDLNLDYPFHDGDSGDWIANGLRLAGEDVRFTGRPPLLPFAIALAERLGLLAWVPVLLTASFHATALAFYRLAARLHPRRVAAAATVTLLVAYSLQGISIQVMADLPAAGLLFLGARSWILAAETSRRYLTSGGLAGLATLAQPIAALWLPAALVGIALARRRDLRRAWPWAGVVLFAAVVAAGRMLQLALAGAGIHGARSADLVRPHLDAIAFYGWSAASLAGLPALGLIALGAAIAARRAADGDATDLFCLTLIAGTVGFFVLLYDFNASRFLLFAVWPVGLLLARGLAAVPRVAAPVAAGLAIVGAALPHPGVAQESTAVALWPAPPVYAVASFRAGALGDPELALDRIGVEAHALANVIRYSQPARVIAARDAWRRGERMPRPEPMLFAGDHSALFLYAGEADGGGRHRTLSRLSNALRRRVKFVPADLLDRHWADLELTATASFPPEYALYRARLPAAAETWLLAARHGGPVHARLRAQAEVQARPGAGGRAGDGDSDGPIAAARDDAEAMLRFLAPTDGLLLVAPDRERAQRAPIYLSFLTARTELIVAERGRERELMTLVEPAPVLAETAIGGARVRRIRLFRADAGVLDYEASAEQDPAARGQGAAAPGVKR